MAITSFWYFISIIKRSSDSNIHFPTNLGLFEALPVTKFGPLFDLNVLWISWLFHIQFSRYWKVLLSKSNEKFFYLIHQSVLKVSKYPHFHDTFQFTCIFSPMASTVCLQLLVFPRMPQNYVVILGGPLIIKSNLQIIIQDLQNRSSIQIFPWKFLIYNSKTFNINCVKKFYYHKEGQSMA